MNPISSAVSSAPGSFHPASSPDYVPRELLRQLQSQRLRQVVERVYEGVARYRQRMHKRGLAPADIRGIEEVGKLPLTSESDLAEAYPFEMFASPIQEVVRLHPPSGRPGKPMVVAYTRRDVEVWAELVVRCLVACGIHRGDLVQNACGYNLFADGLGLHEGIEALGATVVPVSGGDTDHQVMIMKDFGVSAVCSTPGYFLHLAERAEQLGVHLRDLPLRAGAFVEEPWSEAVRGRIESLAGIRAFQIYGVPEIIGPGVGTECTRQQGVHIFEDHFFPEIVDPETGEPVPDGEEGQLVITTLTKEALPLIRYRTPDLAAIVVDPCPCGRTMRRIRRIARRSDRMFVIEGVTISPPQIEAALLSVASPMPEYQMVLTREQGLDRVEVQLEVTPAIFSDQVAAMETFQARLAAEIERTVGIRVPVRLVEPRTIQRQGDHVPRVVDRRDG